MTIMLDTPTSARPIGPGRAAPAQRLAPCRRDPARWDDPEDPALLAMCRQQCPRRFACAADAVTSKVPLEGIWAGIYVPNTQRGREYAMRRLHSLAAMSTVGTAEPPALGDRRHR